MFLFFNERAAVSRSQRGAVGARAVPALPSLGWGLLQTPQLLGLLLALSLEGVARSVGAFSQCCWNPWESRGAQTKECNR